MECEDFCRDTRNKRGGELEYHLNKYGGGLHMAHKRINYKEIERARKRMMVKRQAQIEAKKKETKELNEQAVKNSWRYDISGKYFTPSDARVKRSRDEIRHQNLLKKQLSKQQRKIDLIDCAQKQRETKFLMEAEQREIEESSKKKLRKFH
mmetsp:Transcript_28246/g.32365  ORF Transcript_28246/g.32365 Transcript_28246/m.32365 type:complete len:151 (-) Transcript_28246:16-468(-)